LNDSENQDFNTFCKKPIKDSKLIASGERFIILHDAIL